MDDQYDYDHAIYDNTKNNPDWEFIETQSVHKTTTCMNNDDDNNVDNVKNTTAIVAGDVLCQQNNFNITSIHAIVLVNDKNKDEIDEIIEGIDNNKCDYAVIIGSKSTVIIMIIRTTIISR